MGNPNFLHI